MAKYVGYLFSRRQQSLFWSLHIVNKHILVLLYSDTENGTASRLKLGRCEARAVRCEPYVVRVTQVRK